MIKNGKMGGGRGRERYEESVKEREWVTEKVREREDRRLRIRKTHRCTEKFHPSSKPKSETLPPLKNPKFFPSFNILKKAISKRTEQSV